MTGAGLLALSAGQAHAANVLYRVNAGGPTVQANDQGPVWLGDRNDTDPGASFRADGVATPSEPITNLDLSAPSTTPRDLFASHRADQQSWSFPVAQGRQVEVRFYTTAESGEALSGLDFAIDGRLGFATTNMSTTDLGLMRSVVVDSDGVIDIDLLDLGEKPSLFAIELVGVAPHNENAADASGAGGAPVGPGVRWIELSELQAHVTMRGGIAVPGTQTMTSGASGSGSSGGDSGGTSTAGGLATPTSAGGSQVLFRVNAGGPALGSLDDGPAWLADQGESDPGAAYSDGGVASQDSGVTGVNSSVGDWAPQDLFSSKRRSPHGWSFPVSSGTDIEVRFYMTTVWGGSAAPGARVFDIEVDGNLVLDDVDLAVDPGHLTGGMRSVRLTSDGSVDISFVEVVDNPLVNAIEIVQVTEDNTDNGDGGGGEPWGNEPLAELTPSVDSEFVYVSAEFGRDFYSGFYASQPKQTIAAAASMLREGSADWLMLRRGEAWTEDLSAMVPSGRSIAEPIVITGYGSGENPVVTTPEGTTFDFGSNVVTNGIELVTQVTGGDTLTPGNGWVGPTDQPSAVGSSSHPSFNAKAIARWGVVPYQRADGPFQFGVVAYHIDGIDRVDFSVEGGPWTSVTEMTTNPRTGSDEYWTTLDPASFASDGEVEIRAIVWPNIGIPRVLGGPLTAQAAQVGNHSTFVHVDANNSYNREILWVDDNGSDASGNGTESNPYQSIDKAVRSFSRVAGATLYLKPGSYATAANVSASGNGYNEWFTISAAPGVARSSVIITNTNSDGGHSKWQRWKGVTINNPADKTVHGHSVGALGFWLDDTEVSWSTIAADARVIQTGTHKHIGKYITDCHFENVQQMCGRANIVRNTTVHHMREDLAHEPEGLYDRITVTELHPHDTGSHSDIVQLKSGSVSENFILREVIAKDGLIKAQGLFTQQAGTFDDVALVDCDWRTTAPTGIQLWNCGRAKHLYVLRSTFVGAGGWWGSPQPIEDVMCEDSVWITHDGDVSSEPRAVGTPGVDVR